MARWENQNPPFPDITKCVEDALEEDSKNWEPLRETQRTVAQKWADLVRGLNPESIRPEDSFFDFGGHSLLAQQLLLNFRRELQAGLTIKTLYGASTLSGFSAEMLDELVAKLPAMYQTSDLSSLGSAKQLAVFPTGATRFLSVKGALGELERPNRFLGAYGLWQEEWLPGLSYVIGDLAAQASSTSVLDMDHYIKLSEEQTKTGQGAIHESDDATGVCNTDDFSICMLKGCVQLAARPCIVNTVNAVPVNYMAVIASALNPIPGGVHAIHVTAHPRLRMNEHLFILEYYGYEAPKTVAIPRPCSRRARKTGRAGLDESFGHGVTKDDIGQFLGYRVKTGFIGPPSERGRILPEILVDAQAVEGRGAA
ncbi:hypothetical protein EKO27_g6734 [Xylaria grammica]|uniref:Carrier domain-containing protein n=1 Tax=Xylaria grammica TaxID=363999 RepID=A0A439D1P2_9PEZI|nr:hypothetical protein EKO27_g6734 [Xylaria grammica]